MDIYIDQNWKYQIFTFYNLNNFLLLSAPGMLRNRNIENKKLYKTIGIIFLNPIYKDLWCTSSWGIKGKIILIDNWEFVWKKMSTDR